MKIKDLEKLDNEGVENLSSKERRRFLQFGLSITGVFLGGSILSLSSARKVQAALSGGNVPMTEFPYSPHYTMVIRENHCIGCELCLEACRSTNKVPAHGYRTTILERSIPVTEEQRRRVFMPILCNHCNHPPCVRVCPTRATYKDETNGIVRMNPDKCIGCKTCMAACPYNARYFNEAIRAIDKCNFCYDTKLKESGGKITACAAACPANVRIFGDLSDPESEAYKLIHAPEKVIWVLRPETDTLPNVFYMNA
ncbi:MAG: 4Fe-4S dicluster domain-containing protein [Proteobacteria bacterium]|nr:4Fe-4S dicluster domain-containing protein [Pseudomonadota bacterium]MBU1058070.1 4Fe-4S dicluster domain-containing protein [Pseudomonadota bacterium]